MSTPPRSTTPSSGHLRRAASSPAAPTSRVLGAAVALCDFAHDLHGSSSTPGGPPTLLLPVRMGDVLELERGAPVPDNWTRARMGLRGGIVPLAVVVRADCAERVLALYDFEPTAPLQLRLTAGDELVVLHKDSPEWWTGSCQRRVGRFPASYVEPLDGLPSAAEVAETRANAERAERTRALLAAKQAKRAGKAFVLDVGSMHLRWGFVGDKRPTTALSIIPDWSPPDRPTMPGHVGSPPVASLGGSRMSPLKRRGTANTSLSGLEARNYRMSGTFTKGPRFPLPANFPPERISEVGNQRHQWVVIDGVVQDYEDFEQLVSTVMDREAVPESSPLCMAGAPLILPADRARLCELAFEALNRPGFYLGNAAALSLLAGRAHKELSGPTTGVVVLSGAGQTYTVPVIDGYGVEQLTNVLPLGGRALTQRLSELMKLCGEDKPFSPGRTLSDMSTIALIKEKLCYVAIDYRLALSGSVVKKHYTLGDGLEIELGSSLLQCPELLFTPSLGAASTHALGVSDLLIDSIRRGDPELRGSWLKSIFLSGGSTRFAGFRARLEHDLEHNSISNNHKVRLYEVRSDVDLTWRGAQLVSRSPLFDKLMVTKQEYEESGSMVINRKCF